ncbi:MAG TPA: hypothetical protein VGR06_11260 [Actinophytocola sp.]|uniref:hypothetical protein n=1 Tax=Actinophytocola sp. TaxID=1872138 RepID=UPI002E01D38E|nr:hypothetical protein [Actinophytocola sp.]
MSKPARKPLRRIAWSMLLGGLGVAAVILGIGAFVVSRGESAGPDQAATWPAGTEIVMVQPLGRQQDNVDYLANECTVTPEGGRPMPDVLIWGVPKRPEFTGSATITCRYPAKVLTGQAITIAHITRGPLVFVPLFAAGLSVVFFLPGFTFVASSPVRLVAYVAARITGADRTNEFGLGDDDGETGSGRNRRGRDAG